MTDIVRELTEKEVRGIRRLVIQWCANYDPEYGCLPLDCECVMLGKAYCGNMMCKYFRESVLPNDPELNAALQRSAAKRCKHCGKPFPAEGRRMYCSDICRDAAQRKKTAERVRKHRRKKRRCNDLDPKSVAALGEFYVKQERWCIYIRNAI